MKNKFFSKTCKQTILAVPAAALMLGASHGATIGINYTMDWGSYNPNGTYVPGHYAYMTTGMNVTSTAFGVPAANWNNIQLPYGYTINNTNIIGSLTVVSTAQDVWTSGIGNTNTAAYGAANYLPAIVPPGNDEVTWAYLDDDVQKNSYVMWHVAVSGLKTAYPNGYTLQTIGYPWIFPAPSVNVTDLATFTNSLAYTSLGPQQGAWGTTYAGISSVSTVLTNDSITIYGDPPVGNKNNPPIYHSTLCGFILADAAVVTPPVLSIAGNNLVWSSGTLQSSPTLGPSAAWTTVPNASSPYQFLPSALPSMFYRLTIP
jgi:hypothetical protein